MYQRCKVPTLAVFQLLLNRHCAKMETSKKETLQKRHHAQKTSCQRGQKGAVPNEAGPKKNDKIIFKRNYAKMEPCQKGNEPKRCGVKKAKCQRLYEIIKTKYCSLLLVTKSQNPIAQMKSTWRKFHSKQYKRPTSQYSRVKHKTIQ